MLLPELGLTVARQIPVEMIGGLLSGGYSLHGGVIRNGAGQIVSHLATVGGSGLTSLVPGLDILRSAVANGQLLMLARDVEALQSSVSTVLNVATTGAALSGMGLVVSIAGFAYLSKRFAQVEKLLVDVKELIETRNLADLKAAMGYMKNAEEIDGIGQDNRRSLLLEAHKNFATLAHLYGDLWEKVEEPKKIRALEGFYTLAFTGASIANSELGMHDVAVRQFGEHLEQWKQTARTQIKKLLLGKDPAPLQSLSTDLMTTAEFINLLDFANDTTRGIDWLDEFRPKRSSSWMPHVPRIPVPWEEKPDQQMIATAKLWERRNGVLEAHGAHLAFLAEKKKSVGEFSRALTNAANENQLDAICVVPTSLKIA